MEHGRPGPSLDVAASAGGDPFWSRAPSGAILLPVRLTPRSASDRVEGRIARSDGRCVLAVRVRAVPEKGRANAALIALLARELTLPKSLLRIASGETSRVKTVELGMPESISIADMEERLARLARGA